jgi:peroxiredoxin
MGRDTECLSSQLDAFLNGLLGRLDPPSAEVLRRSEAEAAAHWAAGRHIGKSDLAPDFSLPDQNGTQVTLSEELGKGPVVLSFYRGGWCPFCSLTLRAMDRIRDEVARQGATIMMVSPQKQSESIATARRNFLHFPVLSDADNAVARRYGVVLKVNAERRALLERLGHDLSLINCSTAWELPATVTYVIAPDGRVATAHLDPRINRRMEPAAVLAALRELAPAPRRVIGTAPIP